ENAASPARHCRAGGNGGPAGAQTCRIKRFFEILRSGFPLLRQWRAKETVADCQKPLYHG
ncbi:TPA: hypothetical protein ACFAPN_002240, partial [Neisseria gonorrhoeae]